MNLRPSFVCLAAAAFVVTTGLVGCADPDGDVPDIEAADADLSAAGAKLIGSYTGTGPFYALVLTAEKAGGKNRFFADVDTGIRCVQGPCPSTERIEGTFRANARTVTLASSTASPAVEHLLGSYEYSANGDELTLSQRGFLQPLTKASSYCAEAADCYRENLIVPMCLGQFSCTLEATCKWTCGAKPPADPCSAKTEEACLDAGECQPVYGPSACSPDGICTADMAYKSCETRPAPEPPPATTCLSSSTCAKGEHCSTEDGVCNPYGMLAVCAGTCVK